MWRLAGVLVCSAPLKCISGTRLLDTHSVIIIYALVNSMNSLNVFSELLRHSGVGIVLVALPGSLELGHLLSNCLCMRTIS